MNNKKDRYHIVFVSFIVLGCLIFAGCFEETEILTAYDGEEPLRNFGYSVDIDMGTDQTFALIGAPFDNTRGEDAGAVYVYKNYSNGESWEPVQKLYASDAAAGDGFGYSVSLSGDIGIIGARYDDNANGTNAGAAYVFKLIDNQWIQTYKLIRSNGRADEHFGAAVALDEEYAFIGSPYTYTVNGNRGEVDIYHKEYPGTWFSFVKTLRREEGYISGSFGESISVSISEDMGYAVIGCPTEKIADDIHGGAIRIYSLVNGWQWQKVKRIIDPAMNDYSKFGASVSIDGDYIAVGSTGRRGLIKGAAYIYGPDEAGSPWMKLKELADPEIDGVYLKFGKTVALNAGVLIIGRDGQHDYDIAPAAHVYAVIERECKYVKRLNPAHEFVPWENNWSYFADSIAISEDYAIIGDPWTQWGCNPVTNLVHMYEKVE